MGFPSAAIAGINSLLKLGDGASPEVFTTIAEVRSIAGPTMAVEVVDVTNHDSQNATREKVASLIDPGQLSFDMNFQPLEGTHDHLTGLLDEFENRRTSNYQLVFPGSIDTYQMAGFVTGMPLNFPVDDVITANVTIELTGNINFAV